MFKSILQSAGVLEKDAPVVAAMPDPASAPTQAVQVTRQSLLSVEASPEYQAIKYDQTAVDQIKDQFEQLLMSSPNLVDLYQFLSAAAKLKSISDLKTKYASALDFTGAKPEVVLASADKFGAELQNIINVNVDAVKTQAEPQLTTLANCLSKANADRERLIAELAAVETEIQAHSTEQQNVIDNVNQCIIDITESGRQMQATFDQLQSQIKTTLAGLS